MTEQKKKKKLVAPRKKLVQKKDDELDESNFRTINEPSQLLFDFWNSAGPSEPEEP